MPVSPEYREWVVEQLRRVGPVAARSMFGALGLYHEGLFFGIVADDALYFKVDDSNRADYEEAGTGPFRPYGDQRAMQYYEVPADVLEDPELLRQWAERALAVARSAKRTP